MHLALRLTVFLSLVALSRTSTAQLVIEPIRVSRVATAEIFTEGPVPDGNGGILFSDIDAEKVFRYDIASGATTVAFENSGGANGLAFDQEGRLLAAEGIAQQLTRREGGNREVLAATWNGQPLNSPNDIAVDSGGGIYFTDPDYYHQIQGEGVYYINASGTTDQVLLPSDRPNGIALSPDESRLYLAIPTRNPYVGNPNMEIRQYDLLSPGEPTNERDFVANTFVDGMHVDRFGNVYGATFFGFQIWDAAGNRLMNVSSPSESTNVTLEDPFGAYPNAVYITGGKYLYRAEITPRIPGDFNADGALTVTDVDTLALAIHATSRNSGFDLDGNGVVDLGDRASWLSDAAARHGFNESYLRGDSNLDGIVDSVDLNSLALNWRKEVGLWSGGDFTGDGMINSADLNALALNWQQSIASASSTNETVPEPTALQLTIVAFALIWRVKP